MHLPSARPAPRAKATVASAFGDVSPIVREHLAWPRRLGDGPSREHFLEDRHEIDDLGAVVGVEVHDV